MWESYEIFTLHFRITVKSMSTSANSWFLRNTKSAVISRSFAHHQSCASLLLCCFHLKIRNCLCNFFFFLLSLKYFSLCFPFLKHHSYQTASRDFGGIYLFIENKFMRRIYETFLWNCKPHWSDRPWEGAHSWHRLDDQELEVG